MGYKNLMRRMMGLALQRGNGAEPAEGRPTQHVASETKLALKDARVKGM